MDIFLYVWGECGECTYVVVIVVIESWPILTSNTVYWEKILHDGAA